MEDNKRNYILGIASGFGFTAISAIIGFISVPIALHYWKVEQYGLWILINSVIVYLNISNLGLNSASNYIIARNNNIEIKFKVLERALKVLSISLVFFSVIFYLTSVFFPNWISLLGNIPDNLIVEAKSAAFYTIISFFINAPFSLIGFSPFNKFHVDKYYEIISNILAFVGLLFVIWIKGSLSGYVIVLLFIKLGINIIKTIHFIIDTKYSKSKKIPYRGDSIDIKYSTIIKTSLTYFLAGIASLLVWNVDNFIISNFMNLGSVTLYSITYRLFAIIFTVLQLFINPLIYIFAKEFGNNNWDTINLYYNRTTVILTFISGAAWITSLLFFEGIITLWVGKNNFIGIEVVYFLGAYTFFLGFSYLNYGTICALGYIKYTPLIIILEGIINAILGILFVKKFGLIGMAMSRFISNFIWIAWVYPLILYKSSNKKMTPNYRFIIKFVTIVVLPLSLLSVFINKFIDNPSIYYFIAFLITCFYVLLGYFFTPIEMKGLILEKIYRIVKIRKE